MRLVAIVGACALAGCNDTIPGPLPPNTQLTLHFDSLSAQASAASQPNRVAALNLALRSLADGTLPGLLVFSTGPGGTDTVTFTTVTWSAATVLTVGQATTVTDSLLVLVGWRGANADSMLVVRSGDPALAPQVQSELSTLGLTATHLVTSDTTDTATSAALVGGNAVTVADSGAVEGDFGVSGTNCQFTTVSSVQNDKAASQCMRELVLWQFGLRFSPASRLRLQPGYSPGIVVAH